ncbi:tRNA (mnm(5)s(2)U34)-methyltransferase [Pirellulaceae bacterium SH501]
MHFTVEAQERIRRHAGAAFAESREILAIDATAGNGFDTLFLATLVGQRGLVVAVDRQSSAIEATRAKLEENQLLNRAKLIVGCHSSLREYLNDPELVQHVESARGEESQKSKGLGIDIAMFNLGYLPLGDKSIITQAETTLRAFDQVIARLRSDGILSVISYPGHDGGSEEHRSVCDWFHRKRDQLHLEVFRDESNPRSPVLWLARPIV